MHLVAIVLTLLGCAPARAQSPTAPLEHIEIRTAGAAEDAELPLIVALHGRGDRPEWFAPLFGDLAIPARVIIPRAPHPWGEGRAWFLGARAIEAERGAIARELARHADRVVALTESMSRSRPTRGAPIVTGFSQGAMLTYAIAVRHPDSFRAALPVSGFFFPELLDRVAAPRAPPILAIHGTRDSLVSIDLERRGIEVLRRRGIAVELREHDAPHAITPAMRRDLWSAIADALR